MLIYIAGPYTADTDEGRLANTERAMAAGYTILLLGHTPVIPHFTHWFDLYVEKVTGKRESPESYCQWDLAILARCDALLHLAPSPGADAELRQAEEMGLRIYRSLDEIGSADSGKAAAFRQVWQGRLALLRERGGQHGDASIMVLGQEGLAYLLLTKALRNLNVVKQGRDPSENLQDLANFADIATLLWRGQWGLPWEEGTDGALGWPTPICEGTSGKRRAHPGDTG